MPGAGEHSLPDPRGVGLARLLGLDEPPNPSAFSELLIERAAALGDALALEAAANDDVNDSASAVAYLDLRLSLLADILPVQAIPEIRRGFSKRVSSW